MFYCGNIKHYCVLIITGGGEVVLYGAAAVGAVVPGIQNIFGLSRISY